MQIKLSEKKSIPHYILILVMRNCFCIYYKRNIWILEDIFKNLHLVVSFEVLYMKFKTFM